MAIVHRANVARTSEGGSTDCYDCMLLHVTEARLLCDLPISEIVAVQGSNSAPVRHSPFCLSPTFLQRPLSTPSAKHNIAGAMPPIPSVWHWHSLVARHWKGVKQAVEKVTKALDSQLATGQPQAQVERVLVRNGPKQPLHPVARIRQSQSRWFSTAKGYLGATRHFSSSSSGRGAQFARASFAKTKVGGHISRSSGRTPFASTLRPNLTGGTLGRTSGGYSFGSGRVGGQRFFSHGPASQAQVVQNVSQAVRAFFVSGQKAQFDGYESKFGGKRYKAVSALQEETGRKLQSLPKATPGSRLEFAVNPTITALTSLSGLAGYSMSEHVEADHLNTEGLLDVLSVDFSRALKDLAAVLNCLKRLSALGDLPITYEGSSIKVHFPGCDADTVERICDELNIARGTVIQDEAFNAFAGTEIALLFPFAPSEQVSECGESLFESSPPPPPRKRLAAREVISLEEMFTASSPAYSTQSDSGLEDILEAEEYNPWLSSSPSGYESVRSGSDASPLPSKHDPLEYQGFEGIYRFIEELDAVTR